MAFIKNNLDDEENQVGALATTQESGVVSGGVGADASRAQPQSGWVNFDKYLSANQGQGEGIANAVTAGADGAIKSAAGKLNELEQKAKSTDNSQVQSLGSTKNQVMSDPTKVDVNAYQQQMSQGYKGPTQVNALDGWADAYKAWGSANDQYSAVKDDSAAGRQAAVTNAFKPQAKNGYSQGMATLDSFILGGDQKGKDTLSSFTEANKGIGDSFQQTSSRAQASLDAAKTAYDGELSSVKQAVNNKRQSVAGSIGGKQSQVDSKNALLNEREDVLRSIMSGVATSANKQLDPTQYFASSGRYTLGDLTTDEERLTLEALNNLSDSNNRLDLAAYRPTGKAGVKVSEEAIKAGLGFDYDPETNSLVALASDGGRAMTLSNDPYYKKLIQDALKAKGYN